MACGSTIGLHAPLRQRSNYGELRQVRLGIELRF